jgi:hypothetical protein
MLDMKIVVVDSHKEVLPYWFKEYLELKMPLVGVRIDEHHDMNHECPTLPAREGWQDLEYLARIMPYLTEYAERELNEGNFTCPAVHSGVVVVLYHFDPREEEIDAYGRISGSKIIDAPKTREEFALVGGRRCKRIVWDEAMTKLKRWRGKTIPPSQKISLDKFRADLKESIFPVAIEFDLDALYGISDRKPAEKVVAMRLEKARHILECICSPIFACIARSQTPRTYVPPELVDMLEGAVRDVIEMTYA